MRSHEAPKMRATYEANAAKYLDQITAEETAVKEALGKLPAERRKIITSHDSFGYFGALTDSRSSHLRA